jgi:hypothetical protein
MWMNGRGTILPQPAEASNACMADEPLLPKKHLEGM